MIINSCFGSYRTELFFLQEGTEIISWKWANEVKMKYFKIQEKESAWIQIPSDL